MHPSSNEASSTFAEQFHAAIQSRGLHPPKAIEPDGKLHRFASNGKSFDDAGWYVFYGDGIPAGAFGDWRSGLNEIWRADVGRKLSPREEVAHQARMDGMRHKREADDARRKADAREIATKIWEVAGTVPKDYPYLIQKNIGAHGLRFHDGKLVVQIRDGVDLCSLAIHRSDGDKRFLPGGRVSAVTSDR